LRFAAVSSHRGWRIYEGGGGGQMKATTCHVQARELP
jgi:hypothetical protein